jgi:hypothetical protein
MKVPGFPLNFAPFNEVASFSILYGGLVSLFPPSFVASQQGFGRLGPQKE